MERILGETGVEIGELEPAERDQVRVMLREARLPLDGVEEWWDGFRVARMDGRVAGAIGVERYGEVALLRSAVVAPGVRGGGVGRALVDALLHGCARDGIREVYLLTETAERFFERLGFERIDRGEIPPALAASAELRGACPASATAMRRVLAV
jgi:amino-acid N-acetyltransferase